MSTLFWILIALHVFLCVFLVMLVLIQNDKMGGLAGLGGMTSQSAFSTAGAATFIQKLTRGVALTFFVVVLVLGVLATKQESVGQSSDLKKQVESSGLGTVLPTGITDIQQTPAQNAPAPAAP
jgi:preprotein translocase subunit SecG